MAEDTSPKKKTVSTRVPADTYATLEDYCEDRGISQADALRRFIHQGLPKKYQYQDMQANVLYGRANQTFGRYFIPAAAAFAGALVGAGAI